VLAIPPHLSTLHGTSPRHVHTTATVTWTTDWGCGICAITVPMHVDLRDDGVGVETVWTELNSGEIGWRGIGVGEPSTNGDRRGYDEGPR
jgi:hypothetical protein